jgi:hypothetical protein
VKVELSEKLIADFPYHWAMEQFECDDGWEPLLRNLLADIGEQLNDVGLAWSNLMIECIKEKLGGLRFYYTLHLPEVTDGTKLEDSIEQLVREAEKLSYKTCEVCGNAGVLCSTGSWLKTVCQDHNENGRYKLYTRSWP